MDEEITKLKEQLQTDVDIAFLCHFSGHGGIDDCFVRTVLNEQEAHHVNTYELEKKLRYLSDIANTYVVGILDCSRCLIDPKPEVNVV